MSSKAKIIFIVASTLLWLLYSVYPVKAQQHALAETTEVYGKSVQGRPLTAYILGDGENVTCIFGAFHGNERGTVGVAEKLRAYLKTHAADIGKLPRDSRALRQPGRLERQHADKRAWRGLEPQFPVSLAGEGGIKAYQSRPATPLPNRKRRQSCGCWRNTSH